MLHYILQTSPILYSLKKKINILEDKPDNRVLECAAAGKADIIVTGDKAMLRVKEYRGIKIISLREYLNYGVNNIN